MLRQANLSRTSSSLAMPSRRPDGRPNGPPQDPNRLFRTIETLPRNIGHLKLDGFMPPPQCREAARRAMATVNNADALIIDLRSNGGGMGETALQIAGYLFDRPAYLFRSAPQHAGPVSHRVAGLRQQARRQAGLRPDVVSNAVSRRIFRLQPEDVEAGDARRREKTAGHRALQHVSTVLHLDYFGMGIQETKPPANPYPVKGWEVIGEARARREGTRASEALEVEGRSQRRKPADGSRANSYR